MAEKKGSPPVSSSSTRVQLMEVSSKRNLSEMLFGCETSTDFIIVLLVEAAPNCSRDQGKHPSSVDGKLGDGKPSVVHTLRAAPFCPWKRNLDPKVNANNKIVVHSLKAPENCPWKLGFYLNDISQGKEVIPVSAVNSLDNERPFPFEYTKESSYPPSYSLKLPRSCQCKDGCINSKECDCVGRNGGKFPYRKDGTVMSLEPLIDECSPSCACSASCRNRASQKGIKFHLEIFKTETKGWGVHSYDFIPSGSFICEYAGEALTDEEHDQRAMNDEYFFDIDGFTAKDEDNEIEEDSVHVSTIDAARSGNVGRFVNHSCSPNLYASNVLFDHDIPHIMLFALEDIPRLEELTLDYKYPWDSVKDSDGNIKIKNCYCGSKNCKGRMY